MQTLNSQALCTQGASLAYSNGGGAGFLTEEN